MINEFDYSKFFPYEHIRQEQKIAIDAILKSFLSENKKSFLLSAETGIGKSGVAITIMRYLNDLNKSKENENSGAYILTTQKILQQQYINDFKTLKEIKSSENYQCNFFKQQSCAQSMRMLKLERENTAFINSCKNKCIYKKAKADFLNAPEAITNYSYFLAETVYKGDIKPRNLLVLDECHTIMDALTDFTALSISERFANMIGINMPDDLSSPAKAVKWISKEYIVAAQKKLEELEEAVRIYSKNNFSISEIEIVRTSKQLEKLDKHVCKIHRFLDEFDKENWIFQLEPAQDGMLRKLSFTPIDVSSYAQNLLLSYGTNIFLMSATILNGKVFQQSLGIENANFIHLDSPFPLENKQVLYSPIGKMNKDNIDKSLPAIAESIKILLEHHKNEKGIIHCHTYKIANYIKNALKDRRLLVHETNTRNDALNKHIMSKSPTVLLTPSMTEGIDLYDDLSRFQIICKIPYPYWGSKITRSRARRWNWYYPYQTVKTIVQALGRSIRNENDYCVSYILDQDFEYFYKKNAYLFPEWFQKVLQI